MAFSQIATITPMPTQTTVNLFLGSKRESNYSFAASVVAADDTATTYEIKCKSGALNLPGFPTTTCDLKDPSYQPWTVIQGPSTMIGVLSTAIQNVTAVLDERCAIEARTAAYCNYTFLGNSAGTTTSTAYPTVITGESYVEYPIAITAGADKLRASNSTAAIEPVPTNSAELRKVGIGALGGIFLATMCIVI
ncbi:hypothetical protein Daesc_004394 [Daldinia eschscholtzii]|uniref:Uncharacterized protein n=1 Tax=Daldinia eschscholtzii TaxID=292717 RepID=A0AAX6MPV2_9PEZI